MNIVAKQYTQWCYPAPVQDMLAAVQGGYYEFSDPRLFWPLLWPEGRPAGQPLRILIAGCGTNQAAYNALCNPHAQVTAIDLSMTSLQHQQYLKEKHGLHNLTLHHLNILDVAQLGQRFDLIVSTGVLHHMPEPDAGLQALAQVLEPHGMMSLMVYGKTLRTGVYVMQEAFRRLGLGQTEADVQLVKTVLSSLPPKHIVHSYTSAADDLKYDSGIVDTFLHPQEQAYTVPELMAFIERCGMAFWDWEDRANYSPLSCIPAAHPVHAKLQQLNEVDRWAVVEALTASRGTHRFLLSHPERQRTAARFLTANEGAALDYIPMVRYQLAVTRTEDEVQGIQPRLKRLGFEFDLEHEEARLMELVNGQRTLREVAHTAQHQGQGVGTEKALAFFRKMAEQGHLLFKLPTASYVP